MMPGSSCPAFLASLLLVSILSVVCLDSEAAAGSYELLHEKLLQQVESGNAKGVENILLEGASPEYTPAGFRTGQCRRTNSFETWSPYVLVVANHGHLAVMEILVEYGADVDAQLLLCSKEGIVREGTALMAALMNGHAASVAFLLENGADTEVLEEMYQSTAIIHLAGATRGSGYRDSNLHDADLKNLKSLLEENADIDRQDVMGRTALWLASSTGKVDMVKALINAGASTFVEADCSGEKNRKLYEEKCTPKRIAEIRGYQSVVALFE